MPHLPPGGGVRALGSPSWLVQVKQMRPDLWTSYRYYIGPGQTAEGTWEECKEHWRRIYRRWVDKTYLEQYAPHIDMVSGANEHAATTTWASPVDKARVLQSERAMVAVWNAEYRGRWVSSADGGYGFIPAKTRMCLLAQPVSNDVPVEIMRLALDTDSPIDYRAYCKCINGVRVPECWREHSGRWHFMEQAVGMKPLWMFGESGPYFNTHDGWRSPTCLQHDETKLYGVMRAFFRDVAATPAFREGRILGSHGYWYNTGDPGGDWKDYELDTPHLIRLAQIAREELTPPKEIDVTPEDLQAIRTHANAIKAIADKYLPPEPPPTPQPLYRVRVLAQALNVRGGPGTTFPILGSVPNGAELSVWEVDVSGWLRVHQTEQRWVSGGANYTVKL